MMEHDLIRRPNIVKDTPQTFVKALDFEGLNSFVTLEFRNTYHKELPSLKGAQGMTSHPSPL